MAALSAESLVPLLESEDPELRWAAAKVLGALKPEGDGVVRALAPLLSADDARLRGAALEAVAALGPAPALEEISRLLDEPGDVGRRAIEVLAGLGPDVLKHLQRRLEGACETGRRRILTIAARVRGTVGLDLITRALEAGHGESVKAVGSRLARELESATPREREALRRRLESRAQAARRSARPRGGAREHERGRSAGGRRIAPARGRPRDRYLGLGQVGRAARARGRRLLLRRQPAARAAARVHPANMRATRIAWRLPLTYGPRARCRRWCR